MEIVSPNVTETRARLGRRLGLAALLAGLLVPIATDFAGRAPKLAAVLGIGVRNGLASFVSITLLTALVLGLSALAIRIWRPRGRATVRVEHGELSIERKGYRSCIPLDQIEEGWLLGRSGDVELRCKNGNLLRVATAEGGAGLLEAAGLDAAHRTIRIKLGETTFLTWMTGLLGPSFAGSITAWVANTVRIPFATINVLLFVGLWYGLLRAVYATWGPEELVIGADGVSVIRAFSRRFVPFGDLQKVVTSAQQVRLVLNDGKVVTARARHLTADQRTLIESRIAEARALARGDAPAQALAALDRGGLSLGEWRRALAELLVSRDAYRRAPITAEDLAQALADPTTAAERRLGAAMALAASDDLELRQRVRIAADASASEPMRIALAAVAEGEIEDAAIEQALSGARAKVR